MGLLPPVVINLKEKVPSQPECHGLLSFLSRRTHHRIKDNGREIKLRFPSALFGAAKLGSPQAKAKQHSLGPKRPSPAIEVPADNLRQFLHPAELFTG
jgi:hypothetical protein